MFFNKFSEIFFLSFVPGHCVLNLQEVLGWIGDFLRCLFGVVTHKGQMAKYK